MNNQEFVANLGYPRRDTTSRGRPLKVPYRSYCLGPTGDFQGTLRGPSQKLMILWKNCFLDAKVLVLHIYSCFLKEEEIFKSSKQERPRDVYGCFETLINNLGRCPMRSDYVYFANNEQALLADFTTVLCFTHAEQNKYKLYNNWLAQTVSSILECSKWN